MRKRETYPAKEELEAALRPRTAAGSWDAMRKGGGRCSAGVYGGGEGLGGARKRAGEEAGSLH
jgi:hypothetical protein